MSARTVIILGFAVLLAVTLAAALVTHLRRERLATLSETVAHLTASRPARILAVLIWAWLGWHFLAR